MGRTLLMAEGVYPARMPFPRTQIMRFSIIFILLDRFLHLRRSFFHQLMKMTSEMKTFLQGPVIPCSQCEGRTDSSTCGLFHGYFEIPDQLFYLLQTSVSHLSASQASVCSVREDELPIGLFKPNSKSKIITVLLYAEVKIQDWGLSNLLSQLPCLSSCLFVAIAFCHWKHAFLNTKGLCCILSSWCLSKTTSIFPGWLQSSNLEFPLLDISQPSQHSMWLK